MIPSIAGVVLAEQIGAGGFAAVFRGTQQLIGRDVAVKVDTRTLTDDRDRRRFEREIQAAGLVSAHPHIVSLYDAGITPDNHPYLVMELCGGSYGQRMKESGPIPLLETVDIGIAIADALAAAHDQGILHRDVKPGNVLTSQYGVPMLADFGLAVLPRPGLEMSVTLESLTPAYSAPETFALKPPTAAGDIYSLGTTLYALLIGRAPHSSANGQQPSLPHLLFLLNNPLPPLVDYPEAAGLMNIILRATQAQPQDRYFSAAAMRDALKDLRTELLAAGIGTGAIAAGSPTSATPADTVLPPTVAQPGAGTANPNPLTQSRPQLGHVLEPVTQTQGRNRRGLMAAAAVAALLLGGSSIYLLNRNGTAGRATELAASITTMENSAAANTAQTQVPTGDRTGADQTEANQTEANQTSAELTPTAKSDSTAPGTTAPAFPLPQVGECFHGLIDIGGARTAAKAKSCEVPHYYEVFAVGLLNADTPSPIMSDVLEDSTVTSTCTTDALAAYLDGADTKGLAIEVLPAREVLFYQGDRSFRCLVTRTGAGEVSTSLRGDR